VKEGTRAERGALVRAASSPPQQPPRGARPARTLHAHSRTKTPPRARPRPSLFRAPHHPSQPRRDQRTHVRACAIAAPSPSCQTHLATAAAATRATIPASHPSQANRAPRRAAARARRCRQPALRPRPHRSAETATPLHRPMATSATQIHANTTTIHHSTTTHPPPPSSSPPPRLRPRPSPTITSVRGRRATSVPVAQAAVSQHATPRARHPPTSAAATAAASAARRRPAARFSRRRARRAFRGRHPGPPSPESQSRRRRHA